MDKLKSLSKILIPLVVGVIVLAMVIGIFLYKKFAPSTERMPLTKYFNTSENQMNIILGDEIREEKAIVKGDEIYLGLDFVKEYFNSRFYWDSYENLLLYTTSNAVIKAELGKKTYFVNNSKNEKDYEIFVLEGDNVYVAIDYVKDYSAIEYKTYKNPARVVLTSEFGIDKDYCDTNDDAELRYKPDIKSDILVDLKKGKRVRLLEKENKETGFCKVMEESGVIGYVKASELAKTYKKKTETDFVPESYAHILKDEKIVLAWHQVTNQSANSSLLSLVSGATGVNVVCPTWFDTADNDGNVNSIASDTYVTQAHQLGIEVWGLCNDFTPGMKIGKVLEKTTTRQRLAKNLIAEAIRYSLDGINIDFENVKKESGEDFIQFIRELGIMCRNNGVVLSIDNYPTKDYNKYYNREEQAKVADYVITMAYDEYYSGSEEAGPVSSISYVKEAADTLIAEVPEEQAIVALPFYSRYWTETTKGGKTSLSSEACSMKFARELADDSGQQLQWDDAIGMNYLEHKEGKSIHKMWMEDINSLELKVKEAAKRKVAGVAFWKLGFEDSSVWDMIARKFK